MDGLLSMGLHCRVFFFFKMELLRMSISKIRNEGLYSHPNIVQVFTVKVNKLDSYASTNKPNVHSG